jgi:hypothetical protein
MPYRWHSAHTKEILRERRSLLVTYRTLIRFVVVLCISPLLHTALANESRNVEKTLRAPLLLLIEAGIVVVFFACSVRQH